ncbi:glycosyltransferase family 4 protein [Microbacteriaceae bacterium VKM Ac-2855]|nr:glycosyltransferase family 4 protein [Microbacteriaceae bacterium VKM Ac-2855]
MTEPSRIRLVVDGTPLVPAQLTGVGNVLLATLRAIDAPEFDDRIDVRLFAPFDEKAALERFGFRRIRTVALPLPHRVLGALSRLRVSLPIDLLLGRGVYFFPNFRSWSLARSPAITFVHDVCFAAFPQYVPERRRAFLAKYLPMWLRRSDLVVTGTPSSAREISTLLGVPAEHVGVLPTTVDAAVIHPRDEAAVAAVRQRHGLGRYVIYIGSIERRKNLVTLIDGYVAAERPEGHTLLLVGGTGWDNAEVYAAIRRARDAGADVRLPETYIDNEELTALLTGADALALLSWHEGFGLPALEAIACGTPVVLSDIPGLHDAVRGNEDAAVFVDPADARAVADALSAAMTGVRRVEGARIAPWSDAAEALLGYARTLTR